MAYYTQSVTSFQLAQDEMEMLEEEEGKHHQHNQLDWDDTPLTITVNPMQNWVDEDEEQGIEYLMGGKQQQQQQQHQQRGMSKLGGPTLHLSGAGHLVTENEDELDTSDSEADEEEDESEQELDSDEDSTSSGSEEEMDECIEARTYSHHSGLSSNRHQLHSHNNSSCSKKGKRGNSNSAEEQLEWDSTI